MPYEPRRRVAALFFVRFLVRLFGAVVAFPSFDEIPCDQRGGVGHMNSEEKQPGLAISVSGCYTTMGVVLFLVLETAFHDCGAQGAFRNRSQRI